MLKIAASLNKYNLLQLNLKKYQILLKSLKLASKQFPKLTLTNIYKFICQLSLQFNLQLSYLVEKSYIES